MPVVVPEDSGNAIIIEDSDIQNIRIRIRPDNAKRASTIFHFHAKRRTRHKLQNQYRGRK